MTPAKKLQIFFPDRLRFAAEARSRDGLSEAIREGLSRYYHLLDAERESLKGLFEPGELLLLADANNGTIYTPETIQCFSANAEDTEPEKYAYFGADRRTLINKLNALTIGQTHALVDAVERYWKAAAHTQAVDPAKLLD